MQAKVPNFVLLRQSLTQEIRVRPVAEDRMADGAQMHADLVRAAGVEIAREERRVPAHREHAVRRLRFAGLGRMKHRHLRPIADAAADRRVDSCGLMLRNARDKREISFLHRARFELFLEESMCLGRLRDEKAPRRFLVEAVNENRFRGEGE